tara:strand:+ start:616 stop:924 length:309 start_codon:yes stop_codon:yes gene_type:complete
MALHVLRSFSSPSELGFALNEIKKMLSLNARLSANCEEMLTPTNLKIMKFKSHIPKLTRNREILTRLANICEVGTHRSRSVGLSILSVLMPIKSAAIRTSSR